MTGDGVPPFSETRVSPTFEIANRMTPGAHVPPRNNTFGPTGQIVRTAPLATSTRFSTFPATKAMDRLSGDQNAPNGLRFSDPTIGRRSSESSARIHNRMSVPNPAAANAMRRPSGDVLNGSRDTVPSGGSN